MDIENTKIRKNKIPISQRFLLAARSIFSSNSSFSCCKISCNVEGSVTGIEGKGTWSATSSGGMVSMRSCSVDENIS